MSVPASVTNGREVGALGEVLGELEADAGRGGIGIDAVVEQPEAVLVAQLLILAADVGDLAQVERQPQRIQRRPPHLAVGERPAEHGQRIGLVLRVAGALIGDVGRGRGALQEEGLLARGRGLIWKMVRASRSQLPLSSGVVAAIWPRICKPGAEIVALEGGIGVALRKVAGDLETAPASLLIWASSLIAASARSSRLKALSAANAELRPSASVAQSVAARTRPIMGNSVRGQKSASAIEVREMVTD